MHADTDAASINDALLQLRQGGVIAYPTEGVYGLGCDAANESACERIIQLKQRRPEQGMIVLVADWSQLGAWIEALNADQKYRLAHPPEPFVTWVLPATKCAPEWLTGGRDSLAARIPQWSPLLNFLQVYGRPLVSTSANPHGQAAAISADQVRAYFPDTLDAIWDHPCAGVGRPSSIYRLVDGQQLR